MVRLVVGPGRGESAGPFPEGGLRQRPEFRRCGQEFGDRSYVAQLVAARIGLSEETLKRVDQVVAEAKGAAGKARRGAARLSLWLTAAHLFRRRCRRLGGCFASRRRWRLRRT
jgi:hypothetical protein